MRLLLKIGTKYPSNHEFHPESVPNISRERERTERRKEEEETHTAHSVTHTHTRRIMQPNLTQSSVTAEQWSGNSSLTARRITFE